MGHFRSSRLKVGSACLGGPYRRGTRQQTEAMARERVNIGRGKGTTGTFLRVI